MAKKSGFIIIGVIVVIVVILSVYLLNRPNPFELCKPGEKFMIGPFGERFCYTPSGYEGNPCDTKTDCGTGNCVLINESKKTGRGVCEDVTYGCIQFIDETGSIEPKMCID